MGNIPKTNKEQIDLLIAQMERIAELKRRIDELKAKNEILRKTIAENAKKTAALAADIEQWNMQLSALWDEIGHK